MMVIDPELQLLTIAEAAKVLNVGRSTLYRLMDAGLLDWVKVTGMRRIQVRDLNRYISSNRRCSGLAA